LANLLLMAIAKSENYEFPPEQPSDFSKGDTENHFTSVVLRPGTVIREVVHEQR